MQSPLTTALLPLWSQSLLSLTQIVSMTSTADRNQTVFLNPPHCSPHSWRGWKIKSHISQSPSCNLLLLLFCCQVVSSYFSTPWTIVHQAPLSMRFPRQEYWTGLSFPSPGDLPNPGMEPELAGRFFTTEPPGKPPIAIRVYQLVPDNNHTQKIQKVGNGIIFLMM